MKATQARIADLWCSLMHGEPMWPAHGQYECRTCGRRYPVCWQEQSPAASLARHPSLNANPGYLALAGSAINSGHPVAEHLIELA
jgi:hypothetical protein